MQWIKCAAVLCLMLTLGPVASAKDFGINQPNMAWDDPEERAAVMRGIAATGANWVRDTLPAPQPWGTPEVANAAFLDVLRLADRHGLNVLAVVIPQDVDYGAGIGRQHAGKAFQDRCGWAGGALPLKKIDLGKFAARLDSQLKAVRKARLPIHAFEIGNEFDWICFNADVPNGRTSSPADVMGIARSYARFLQAAAEVIQKPENFPEAKLITFGISHADENWDRVPHHVARPARILAALKNLDGFNYLNNARYRIDAIGVHMYPAVGNISSDVSRILNEDLAILEPDVPIWITEWGFRYEAFQGDRSRARATAIATFQRALEPFQSRLGPSFYFNYAPLNAQIDFAVTDRNYRPLPEAELLDDE